MNLSHRTLIFLAGVALAATAASAQTTLYNNLNATIGNYYPITGPNQPDAGPLYNSFSTGSSALQLTDVKVNLELMDAPEGTVNMALFSNSGNYPGSVIQVIGSISDSAVSFSGGVYDFPVSPNVPLTANTRYFIGLYPTKPGNVGTSTDWASTDSTAGSGIDVIANEYTASKDSSMKWWAQTYAAPPGRTARLGWDAS